MLAYTLLFIIVSLLIPTSEKYYFPIIEEDLDWPMVVIIVLVVLYPFIFFIRYGTVHPAIRVAASLIAALPATALLIYGVDVGVGRLIFENYYWVARTNWLLVYLACLISTWFFFQGLTSPTPQTES